MIQIHGREDDCFIIIYYMAARYKSLLSHRVTMSDTQNDTHIDTDTNSPLTIFDWRDVSITKWKKVLRIVLKHSWKDVKLRGYTAQESASMILSLHESELNEEEKAFLKGLLT